MLGPLRFGGEAAVGRKVPELFSKDRVTGTLIALGVVDVRAVAEASHYSSPVVRF
jgi:hypothetical protein